MVLTYTVSATDDDGTPLSDTETVTVTITGTNDDPVVSIGGGDSAAETLTETNTTLTSFGTLTATDLDLTDSVTSSVDSVIAGGDVTGLQSNNAALLAMLTSTTNVIDGTESSDTLTWNFNSAAEAFDYLGTGQSLTLTYAVTVTDSQGATDTQNVVITINGSNDRPNSVDDSATAVESGGIANATAGSDGTGNVLANDTDVDEGDTQTVSGVVAGSAASASGSVGAGVVGNFGTITIDASGNYTYVIDESNAAVQALRTSSDTLTDVFTYTMQDAAGLDSTAEVTITIQGANDNPHDLSTTGLTVAENSPNSTFVGSVTSSDVDAADTATYSLTDDAGGRFAIDASGNVTVADSSLLDFENATSHTITVRVTDTAGATYDENFIVNLTDVDEFRTSPPRSTSTGQRTKSPRTPRWEPWWAFTPMRVMPTAATTRSPTRLSITTADDSPSIPTPGW